MLHNLLSEYLKEIEASIQPLKDCYVEKYEEEFLTPERINLRIRIRFLTGDLLELNESLIVVHAEIVFLSYRYHMQNKQNDLIFRYDNTPHFPEFDTYPHHLHLPDETIATAKPSIPEVLLHAQKQI